MRRNSLLVIAAILIVAATPFRVRALIENALANERDAAARYEVFAAKADDEGLPGAASFFRAAAHAEHTHALRFEAILTERGIPVPEAHITVPTVGATIDNLRAAALAESAERDGIYREAVETALDHKEDALAKAFDQSRDTEVEHANILGTLLRNADARGAAKTYYVCGGCGYTSDVKLPLCALCRSTKGAREIR